MFKIDNNQINSTKQPKNMTKMLEIAAKLAQPFPFVRVDMYETKDKVYAGELTFYPGNGFNKFTPKSLDVEMGKLLDLSATKQEYLGNEN